MKEFRFTPGKVVFIFSGTVLLVGTLTYLRLAFEGADVKTSIRLVEEAKAFGVPLRQRINEALPLRQRFCEARSLDSFQGHMEVVCRDTILPLHLLKWQVNVIDGQVIPANDAAIRLGKGEAPWATK